jgi:glyoxylase-like metal-dependent hydrolase (beta-lactamase superfamily II)
VEPASELIELKSNVFHVPGKNRSRFPYCSCLYLKGRNCRVLIDAGMGAESAAEIHKRGIDLIILSHCHIDHRLSLRHFGRPDIFCHEKEAEYLLDRQRFLSGTGFDQCGLDLSHIFRPDLELNVPISGTMTDGQVMDLGGLTLEVLHTPGHTPGHMSFHIPEHRLLFSADIDLSAFGPFYGHYFAHIGDFLASIQKLKKIEADLVVSGHSGPYRNNLADRYDAYAEVVHRRDHLILKKIIDPVSVKDLVGHNLIYKSYGNPPDLMLWFEKIHISKHLERLVNLGLLECRGGCWTKTGHQLQASM